MTLRDHRPLRNKEEQTARGGTKVRHEVVVEKERVRLADGTGGVSLAIEICYIWALAVGRALARVDGHISETAGHSRALGSAWERSQMARSLPIRGHGVGGFALSRQTPGTLGVSLHIPPDYSKTTSTRQRIFRDMSARIVSEYPIPFPTIPRIFFVYSTGASENGAQYIRITTGSWGIS